MEFNNNEPAGAKRIYYRDGKVKFSGDLNQKTGNYKGVEYYKSGKKRADKELNVKYVLSTYFHFQELNQLLTSY
jgi:antitoxin component YwqK of YwqJK toxin-antitoxin module